MERGHTHPGHGGGLRQGTILLLLVAGLVLLHRFAVPSGTGFDPTAMLAFGFVVLASYAAGQLAEAAKLPNITGYLVAGILFGPSIPQFLPASWQLPPFERGVLNDQVMQQLGLLDALAVALIAMTAGGELKVGALRRGARSIGGLLLGQTVLVCAGVLAFLWAVSGGVPTLAMPGLELVGTTATLFAVGFAVACVTLSTSPAATIAVITDAGARGPMTRNILSTVVLKDVIVLVGFAVASSVAARSLGVVDGDLGLGRFLLTHVLGSVAMGAGLGVVFALYLRYVRHEMLLFLVGIVYTATYLASGLRLDPVLLFLAAGFTVGNLSRRGGPLIDSIEQLSMPVYVVFFTLAGARLHLDELFRTLPFAAALVGVRVAALWIGVVLGGRAAGTDRATRRFGWMGFISQAGVALSLSMSLQQSFGDLGATLATLLVSTIALNELVGPIALKLALGFAQEVPRPSRRTAEEDAAQETEQAPARKPPGERPALGQWPKADQGASPWGGPPATSSKRLHELLADLQGDLQGLVRETERGPLEEFRRNAELYLRELRREFLRHHRRLIVQARAEGDAQDPSAARTDLATRLRAEQSELAERWRGIVLGRAARLRQSGWTPESVVEAVDRLVEGLPEEVEVPWEPESFMARPDESLPQSVQRTMLRLRRRGHAMFGSEMPPRSLAVRTLARYHLSGRTPKRLEGVAALLVQGDRHIAERTRSIFDAIVRAYDELAERMDDEGVDPNDELVRIRRDVEEELSLALDELVRMARDGSRRTALVLGEGLGDLKEEVAVFGTLDLPTRKRRSGRVYRERVRALETLTESFRRVRRMSAAGYSLLGLELELVGLEARVKDTLEEHVRQLESDVRGRARIQVERVHGALEQALDGILETLEQGTTGEEMAMALRRIADNTEKVAGEAARAAVQLRDQLSRERTVAPLLDALGRAARTLTDRYEVSGRLPRGEWKLPAAPTPVEVPFRELVSTYIDAQVAPKLVTSTREMADKVQPLATSLQELERLIAFNTELATGELEVMSEETVPDKTRALLRDMVAGALERNKAMIATYIETSQDWPEQMGRELRQTVLGRIEELRRQLVDGDISKARVESLRRSAASRRLAREAGALPGRLSVARKEFRRATRRVLGEERIERWRRNIGVPRRAVSSAEDTKAFAPPRATEEIPLVYRRLFAPGTLEAGDVLTGRDPEIARARSVLTGEAGGTLRAVALVGPDGVGKAAVSGAIVRTRSGRNVRRVNLTKPAMVRQVETLFKEKLENQLVVVDGLHWLVAMRPGGFEPLRRFVDGVIADNGRNAWLVHGDLLFWQYAAQVAPLEEAFPEVVHLEPLSPEALQSAVLARHALSGYGLTFEPAPGSSRLERALIRGAGRLRRPYERYFQQLHAASGGLVRDALRLWLASIEEVDETEDSVHIGPVPPAPSSALRRLPQSTLLNLYLIARQGWMDADIQSWVFRADRRTAEAQLARLAHLQLLEQHEQGVYRIAVHLRGAVVQVLREQGWVR